MRLLAEALFVGGVVYFLGLAVWGAVDWLGARRAVRRADLAVWDSTPEQVAELGDVLRGSVSWEERQATFAAVVAAVRRRAEILREPTKEYRQVIRENFGVELDTVGPRELDLIDGEWEQPALDLAETEA